MIRFAKMSPGQTIVHEWSHLSWIQMANSDPATVETYGFVEAARLYKNKGIVRAMNNADTWAVFASYNAYNQYAHAPTNGRGCKDVWPRQGGNNQLFSPAKPNPERYP